MIKINKSLLTSHYNALTSSVEDVSDPYDIKSDTKTSIPIKSTIEGAYSEALSYENALKNCLLNDAEIINKLGQDFVNFDEEEKKYLKAVLSE